jgi:hypothetical protein
LVAAEVKVEAATATAEVVTVAGTVEVATAAVAAVIATSAARKGTWPGTVSRVAATAVVVVAAAGATTVAPRLFSLLEMMQIAVPNQCGIAKSDG